LLNGAATWMVACALAMLASALWRLSLYEEAYGYSYARLVAGLTMFLVAAVLLWRAVTLWRWQRRFAVGVFFSGLAFLAVLDAINPDELVARRNLQRYAQTGKLDGDYLSRLSVDALPAIAERIDDLPAIAVIQVRELTELRLKRHQQDGWASLHLSRWRATRLWSQFAGPTQ
jgi:hypothetical protein